MTVGELRTALEGLPDDRVIVVVDDSRSEGSLYDLEEVGDADEELRKRLKDDHAGPEALVFFVR